MTVEIRPVEPADFDAYYRAESAGFGELAAQSEIDLERTIAEVDRSLIVVDPAHPEQIIGTLASFSFELTVPGQTTTPVGGLSGVSVAATHRRQGILRELMGRHLDEVASRGELGSVLLASKASIYGRFGYGVATRHARYEIDTTTPVLFANPPAPRSLRFVGREEALRLFPAIRDSWRRQVPGAIGRSDPWWRITLGSARHWKGGGPLWFVMSDPVPEDDDPGGYVLFELEAREGELMKRLSIRELCAAHPETAAALWKLCLDHDMATSVVAPVMPVDDPFGWRLSDPRALRTTAVGDFLWLRLVDVEAALSARAYFGDGSLTLSVTDPFRPDTGGVYRLQVTDGIGRCRRVSTADSGERVDLDLGIDDLASLYLGGVSVSTLAAAGRITLWREGVDVLADAMFVGGCQPFCDTFF